MIILLQIQHTILPCAHVPLVLEELNSQLDSFMILHYLLSEVLCFLNIQYTLIELLICYSFQNIYIQIPLPYGWVFGFQVTKFLWWCIWHIYFWVNTLI